MPSQISKLGYVCTVCGLDYGWDECVTQRSSRKRGEKTHVISRRRDKEERIRFRKPSSDVEHGLKRLPSDHYESVWLDSAASLLMKSRKDGTWNSLPIPNQDAILKKIAEMKQRVESKKKAGQDVELRYKQWNVTVTKEDSPFYELAMKVSSLYQPGCTISDHQAEITLNPAFEIMRYRSVGDPLVHLDTSEIRQIRVLVKYPSLIEQFKNGDSYPMMDKGSKVVNRYREPFHDKKWIYSWVEQFWIVLYSHIVSPREAARMVRALDGLSIGKLSWKHIKNQIEPVVRFWQDFFGYVPYYLAFLNTIEWIIRNDPELSGLDQQGPEEGYDTVPRSAIERLASTRHQQMLHSSGEPDNGTGQEPKELVQSPCSKKIFRVSKEMIRVHHPNLNYRKEMDEFNNGLRIKKPKRMTSSCYFDPWKQPPEVLGALIRKGKIHLS